MAKGIMVVATSPVEGREDEYNDWYSNDHVPQILGVPGFVSAQRYKLAGGPEANAYLAIYEIEADELTGPAGLLREASASQPNRSGELIATDPAPVIRFYELID